MAIEEECECEGGSDAAWMATFADLMSLLLTFFVLLLSFANMDVVRFKVVLGSVRDAFGVQFEHPGDMEAISTSIVAMSKEESSPTIKVIEEVMMLEKVKKIIKDEGMEDMMSAELDERGVVIRIKGHILFRSGEAELRDEGLKALGPVIKLAKAMDHQLSIQGHTDDRPISTSKFPSNWELSTARAVATMRYLSSNALQPARMNVAGYANMRPLAKNTTAAGRAKNRRVEFVFLRNGDRKTITKEEIEAAKREIARMREDNSLLDDPQFYDDGGVRPPRDGGPISESTTVDAQPPSDAGPTFDAAPDAAPDAGPIVAPDLSPDFSGTDVSAPSVDPAVGETPVAPPANP
ncbi:MAG: OmpA family protein [Myxococcales bacterium]|nr:OmpA family protein [Myxococcales bacterium]